MMSSPMVARKGAKKNCGGQNIKVFVRVRPMNSSEKNAKCASAVECQGQKEIVVQERPQDKFSKKFSFDKVFGEKSAQVDIYKSVAKPLVEEVLNGFNCTIFAYGQTGTGKTFTMEGEPCNPQSSWDENPKAGIIPRCVNQLFDELRIQQLEFTMRVSFLELYNEELFDLLSAHDDLSKLRLYEDASRKGSCIIQGLEEVLVRSKSDVYNIVEKGSAKRQTAATLMNAHSSRSHTVFTVTIHIKESSLDGTELLKTGKLHLVDLAGSENIGRSGAVDKRAREAGNINQSLLTLGRVITSLVDRTPHVPYRESKLTRLLQDALGGRTKTSIIATVSPASVNLEETLSTLDYAHRAKNIQNKPEVNQKLNKKELITEYTFEIDRLRKDLMAMREKNGVYLANENYQDMLNTKAQQDKEISEKISHIKALEEDLEKQKENFAEVNQKLEDTTKNLLKSQSTLATTKVELGATQKLLSDTAYERDEQKFLVSSHQKTEKKLLKQGHGLVSVADTTTSDIEKLHAKLDRKRNVENQNEKIEQDFTSHFESEIKMIQQNTEKSVSKMNEASSTVCESLSCDLSNHQQNMKKLKKEFDELTDWSSNTLISIRNGYNDHQSNASNIVSSLIANVLESSNTKDRLSTLKIEDLEPKFTSIYNVLNQIQEEVKKHNTNVSLKLSALEESTQTTCSELVSLSGSLDQMHKKFVDEQLKNTAHMQEETDNYEQSEMEGIDKMEQMLRNMTNLLQEQKQRKIQHKNIRVECQNKMQKDLQEFSKNSSNLSSDLKQEVLKYGDEMKTHGNYLQSEVDNSCQIQTSCNNMVRDNMNDLKLSVLSGVDETIEDIKKLEVQAIDSNSNYKSLIEEYSSTLNTNIQKMDSDLSENLNQLSQTIQEEEKDVKEKLKSDIESIGRMTEQMEDEISNHKHLVDEAYHNVLSLFNSQLQKDLPTGETPVRKEYPYSRNLAQTSPHEKLLAKFRLCSETESKIPLPDTSGDLEDDLVENSSLQSLPATWECSEPQNFTLQRSESFKESSTFAIPAPRVQRQNSKEKTLTKCSSESSLKDAKENNDGVGVRKLKAPTAIGNFGKVVQDSRTRSRKVLGNHN